MAQDLALGLAVGLGVGVPILVIIGLLTWFTIRHNRKIKEEDAEHEKIDFNGDVEFYDTELHGGGDFTSFDTTSMSDIGGSMRKTSVYAASSYAGSRRGSFATTHTGNHEEPIPPAPIRLYTPSIVEGQVNESILNRQLNSVYGPSPAYPSSDRLRANSVGSISHNSLPGTPKWQYNNGPFATPPRPSFGERRMSSGSAVSDILPLPMIGAVPKVESSPHPYTEIVGDTALEAAPEDRARALQPRMLAQKSSQKSEADREKGKHLYRQHAENRQSVFEY